jgi:hypothetical protein
VDRGAPRFVARRIALLRLLFFTIGNWQLSDSGFFGAHILSPAHPSHAGSTSIVRPLQLEAFSRGPSHVRIIAMENAGQNISGIALRVGGSTCA